MATRGPDEEPPPAPAVRDAVEVLVEEFFERRRRGEASSVDDFARRVPGREDEFREMVDLLGVLESAATSALGERRRPGATLGRFVLARLIGRGGMGAVYEAYDRDSGRPVALKLLPGHATLDAREIERFRREAQAAARLRHPHIVPILDVGEDEGTHWIAMQFVPGQSLDRVVRERGEGAAPKNLPPHEVARHGLAVAEALAAAHAQGVLHRDVKPSNLLLDTSGAIWITDFGLAKTEGAATLTRSGELVGTPRYMAPEAFKGWADPRTDVWGLGATLYELLAGRPAFDGRDRARLLKQIFDEEPVALRRLDPALPVDLATIVERCLQKEPELRYGSARELADDLAAFLEGRPILARPPTRLQRAARLARRHRVAVGAAAIVLVVGSALSIAWAVTLGRKNSSLKAAKDRAEANLEIAVGAIDDLLERWSDNSLARSPAHDPLRRQILLDALDLQQRLLAGQQGDARVQIEVAQAESRIGTIDLQLVRCDEARRHFDAATRILRELVAASPEGGRPSLLLSQALVCRAGVARATGDLAGEIAALEEARAVMISLLRGDPRDDDEARHLLRATTSLADAMARDRRPHAAAEMLAADLARAQPLLLAPDAVELSIAVVVDAFEWLATAQEQEGEAALAAESLASAAAASRRAVELVPDDWNVQRHDATIRCYHAALLARVGREDEARPQIAAACDDLERLAKRWPMAPALRAELARALERRARVERLCEPTADIVPLLERSIELSDGCRAEWPEDPDELAVAINTRCTLARAWDDAGTNGRSDELTRATVALAESRGGAGARTTSNLALAAAIAHLNRSVVAGRIGLDDEALAEVERAHDLLDWIAAGDGRCWSASLFRLDTRMQRAALLAARGKPDEAAAEWRETAAEARRLEESRAARNPADVDSGVKIATALVRAQNLDANGLLQSGDREAAAARIAEAVAAAEAAHARWPGRGEIETRLAIALADSGNVALAAEDPVRARAQLALALYHLHAALARAPRAGELRRAAGWIVDHLAIALRDARDVEPLVEQATATADLIADDAETQMGAARLLARAAAFKHASLVDAVTAAGAHDPWADAALDRLRRAAADGLDVAARARDDPALAVLESRDDYRRWLAGLNGRSR